MHIIVVGCGRVGSRLATELAGAGHKVAIIDKQEAAFRRLPPNWGGEAIVGFGFDRDDLEHAGASSADALAAVTNGDNSNILTARIARETFQIPAVIARIYDPRRAEIYQRLGIPTVATVTWTAEQVMRGLFPNDTVTDWTDSSGQIQLVQRTLPVSWCGQRIATLEARSGARIVSVTRAGVPSLGPGDLVGQEGDILHLAVTPEVRVRLDDLLGVTPAGSAAKA